MSGREEAYVQEAFRTNWLSTVGPHLSHLEQQFETLVGVPAVALASGTAGIHIGVRLLGIGPGDEVLAPTLTFAASCNPILYQNGTPILTDCDSTSWNIDPNLLAEFLNRRARINRLPKALIVVHLYGQSVDLQAIVSLCRQYDVLLLEDAAHALGTVYRGRQVGSFGDVGVFSLGGNKVVTATAGGILVSRQPGWTDKARFWSTQARDPDPRGLNNYVHSELGYNYRMSNVLAGIALGQIELLETRVARRRAIFERYRASFEDIPGILPQAEVTGPEYDPKLSKQPPTDGLRAAQSQRSPGSVDSSDADPASRTKQDLLPQLGIASASPAACGQTLHSRWLSCFVIEERRFGMAADNLIRFLDAANVEARPVWKPMHTQVLFQRYERLGGQVAEELNRRGICLPSSSGLSDEEQQFVIDRVREAHLRSRR